MGEVTQIYLSDVCKEWGQYDRPRVFGCEPVAVLS